MPRNEAGVFYEYNVVMPPGTNKEKLQNTAEHLHNEAALQTTIDNTFIDFPHALQVHLRKYQ